MILPSKLIPDANILFSFFKSDSVRLKLIEELLNNKIKLISPDFVLEELIDNKEKIKRFARISEENFSFGLSIIKKRLLFMPKNKYKSFLSEAHLLSPHKDSSKDDPYFALSLSLNNSPIWSDEIAFKKQSKIKIFSTEELLQLIKV